MPDSSISKFFEKSRKDRLEIIGNFANLSEDELNTLENIPYLIKSLSYFYLRLPTKSPTLNVVVFDATLLGVVDIL